MRPPVCVLSCSTECLKCSGFLSCSHQTVGVFLAKIVQHCVSRASHPENPFCHVRLQSWPWTLVVPQLREGLSEVCVAGGAERCVSKRTVCLPNTTRQLGLGVKLWQVLQRQSPCSHLLCSCAVCAATMGQACLNLNPFPNPEP